MDSQPPLFLPHPRLRPPQPRPAVADGEWQAAQASLAVPLARAAAALGALDDRLAGLAEGHCLRLALAETAALWSAAGEPVAVERLAARLPRGGEGAASVGAANARAERVVAGLMEPSPTLPPGEGLHPLVAAAADFAGRCRRAPAADSLAAAEAAAAAGRLAVAGLRGGARFLPVGLGGARVLAAGDGEAELLGAWLADAEAGCRAGLARLDAVAAWRVAARAAAGGFSGRTARRLVEVFWLWPAVTAPLAGAESGASRAAVQRNLDRLTARGLVREITGQGRNRVWTAALPAQSM